MSQTFRGERLHIVLLGRCNTGKSTLLNLVTGQKAAIVSAKPGTTGDPMPIAFELLPFGPVTFYDTAGLDESSELGILRRQAGRKVLTQADMAVVITDENGLGPLEQDLITALRELGTPFLVVFNKRDLWSAAQDKKSVYADIAWCEKETIPYLALGSEEESAAQRLREALLALTPAQSDKKPLVTDILSPGKLVICVTPIDDSAPAGRLIAPQVQAIRELVEYGHPTVVVQPAELPRTLEILREAPGLVITDSQAVLEVAAILPATVPLTTFSVLFARRKGDFPLLLEGARSLDALKPEDKILIAEACSHHAQNDDIARVKIPALLRKHLGFSPVFAFSTGRDFPEDLSSFALAIHCGGCMLNPGEMRRRLRICAAAGVPASNFGMVISQVQGLLERVSAPLLLAPVSK